MRYYYPLVASILLVCGSCALPAAELPTDTPETVVAYPSASYVTSDYPGPGVPQPTTPEAPGESPEPISGKAAISGVFYSYTSRMVVPETMFFLIRAVGEDNRQVPPVIVGPQTDKGDVPAQTNEKGQFILNDVSPGNYYVVIWSPNGWVLGTGASGDIQPLLLELKPDKVTSLNVVYLAWP